ncbi:alpha-L-fucosidase [Brochothrix thermosphacta]|uniref:alpha-L-fucosidase n=1 Tax=Brochothrix thermosphacta TaxID=2756 RepID=UPI0039B087C4
MFYGVILSLKIQRKASDTMSDIRADIEENIESSQEKYEDLKPELSSKIEWFKDQKIGVIFHWGLYSEAGIVESWQLSAEDNWARKKPWRNDLTTLRHDYWQLNKNFNPLQFNPNSWAKQVKDAGFKYMLFTTKHHDGFNMYDTQLSPYKVTHKDSPFANNQNADIFKAITNAFRAEDISVGAYYSKPDWHSPYYWEPGSSPIGRYASYSPLDKPTTWQKFNNFVSGQLNEICQNYGDIDILWLDGGWVNSDNNEYLDMAKIVPQLRKHQPALLVVDHTIGGEFENYVTPERKIPEELPNKAWESNIPLAKNWGYVPNDIYKPFSEILETLIKIVSLGGNVILGIGPKPDGTLPQEAQNIMSQLGKWLAIYGEGIYDTRPYKITTIGNWYFTKKQNYLFAYLMPHEHDITLNTLDLQSEQPVHSCENLATGTNIPLHKNTLTLPASTTVTAIKIKF